MHTLWGTATELLKWTKVVWRILNDKEHRREGKKGGCGGEVEVKMCLERCELVWSVHGLHTTSELI